jgi:hypothetical protein
MANFLCDKHLAQWRDSGISDSITRLNTRSLSGSQALDRLLYSENLPRLNTGILSSTVLKRYQHVEKGGWWAFGLDPLSNWEPMEWGTFKPDFPRSPDGKEIKYEHPPKEATRAFFLDLGLEDCLKIARKHGKEAYFLALVDSQFPALTYGQIFWNWVMSDRTIPNWICEGVKKAACLLSQGHVAIALPGVTGAVRVERDGFGTKVNSTLIPEIELFAGEGRTFYLCFDEDIKPKTRQNVDREKFKLGQLLLKSGSEVGVLSWNPSFGKGIDDFLVVQGTTAGDLLLASAVDFKRWCHRSQHRLSYPAKVASNSRYLPEIQVPLSEKLIVLKAPKGTGKTELIRQIISQSEQPVLNVTHLRSLTSTLSDRFGITNIRDIRGADSCDRAALKTLANHEGLSLVVNSVHPQSQAQFNPEDYFDHQIVLDEVSQVLDSLLNSATCKKDRAAIIQTFSTLIRGVFRPESLGRLVISDADLGDKEVRFFLQLATGGEVDPFIIVNNWTAEDNPKAFQYPDSAQLLKELETQLSQGKKAYVFTDSQKGKSRFSSISLENYFKKHFPHLKILRIDSETTKLNSHPAFGAISLRLAGANANLNQIVGDYDLTITSPCVQSGASIDIKGHFNAVFGFFNGVVSPDVARQSLARVREPVPRYFFSPARGLTSLAGGELNSDELLANQKIVSNLTLQAINSAALETGTIDQSIFNSFLVYWSQKAAEHNRGRLYYRDFLVHGLEEENFAIYQVDPTSEDLKPLKRELADSCDRYQIERGQKISEQKLISQEEAKRLEDSPRGLTQIQQLELEKYGLATKYSVEVTADLFLKDSERWLPKIKLYYYLGMGREQLVGDDRTRLEAIANRGSLWLPDIGRSTWFVKVRLLEALGFPNLIAETAKEWRNSDLYLIDFAEKCQQNSGVIRQVLGLSIHPDHSAIAIFGKFLKLVGIDLHCDRKEGGRGQQERVYRFQTLADFERENQRRREKGLPSKLAYLGFEDTRNEVFHSWKNSVVSTSRLILPSPTDYREAA